MCKSVRKAPSGKHSVSASARRRAVLFGRPSLPSALPLNLRVPGASRPSRAYGPQRDAVGTRSRWLALACALRLPQIAAETRTCAPRFADTARRVRARRARPGQSGRNRHGVGGVAVWTLNSHDEELRDVRPRRAGRRGSCWQA